MSKSVTMKIKSNSFRKLDDPFSIESNAKKYIFYVKIGNLSTEIPMDPNPREQNTNSNVAKAIQDSIVSNDHHFHLLNRGIVLSAKEVRYNNKFDEVTIDFGDEPIYGNIDGGHTYKIACQHIDDNLDQYVQFEVMTGVENMIRDLADARNTSVQVDEKSLAELANHFEPIKEALEGTSFFNRIAFKQNQITRDENTGKKNRMIDAREIVAIISMFNIYKYSDTNHPVSAYSGKAKMLDQYLEDPDFFRKFINIAVDIFDLYDAVEVEFPDAYNATGGKYGSKKFSQYDDGKIIGKSKFGCQSIEYRVPDGLIYPVVASFRSLVEEDRSGFFRWKKNPIQVWTDHKSEIVQKVMSFTASIGNNPNTVGKDSNIWDLEYMTTQKYAN